MDWDTVLEPLLAPLGLSLYDVEFAAGTLSVVVNRPGGVDVEALTAANRAISEWLDANDPIDGRFTLDVSSPGLERRLRTPAHFASALGERVTLRELRGALATRRLEGPLVATDGESVTLDDGDVGIVTVAVGAVERARTVFIWGASKPVNSKSATKAAAKSGASSAKSASAKGAASSSTSRKG